MLSHELVQELAVLVREGQAELAATVRGLLYQRAPLLMEMLDIEDDGLFLEPALFAWLTARREDIELEQLLYAYLPEAARPSRLWLMADAAGAAHLPRLGSLAGLPPLQRSEVWRQGAALDWTRAEAPSRPLSVTPARFAAAGALEFTHVMDPLLPPLFSECARPHEAAIASDEAAAAQTRFNHALSVMRQVRPDIYRLLGIANRRVQIYRAEAPNSFASLSMHGAAFFNLLERPGTVFFLDDFAHQGGHVVFNAATLEQRRFLNIDPKRRLCELIAGSDDERSLYSAFHGLFTYSLIVSVLLASLRRGVFEGVQLHELRGRLGFYLLKFQRDLQSLARPAWYCAEGVHLYRGFRDCFEGVVAACAEELRELDYSNQPYVFHYGRFSELNPAHAA